MPYNLPFLIFHIHSGKTLASQIQKAYSGMFSVVLFVTVEIKNNLNVN